jgi:hypothetical protein
VAGLFVLRRLHGAAGKGKKDVVEGGPVQPQVVHLNPGGVEVAPGFRRGWPVPRLAVTVRDSKSRHPIAAGAVRGAPYIQPLRLKER